MANIFDIIKGKKSQMVFSTYFDDATDATQPRYVQTLLTVEVTTNFKQTRGLTVTEHPVESGSSVSDHAQVKLIEASVDCVITEAPLTIYGGLASVGASLVGGSVGGTAGAAVTGGIAKLADKFMGGGGEKGVIAVKKILNAIVNEKKLMQVTYKNHVLTNMLMTELTYNDDINTGHGISFSATLKETRFVSGKSGKAKPTSKSSGGKSDVGTKQPVNVDESKTNKLGDTALLQLLGG